MPAATPATVRGLLLRGACGGPYCYCHGSQNETILPLLVPKDSSKGVYIAYRMHGLTLIWEGI